MLGSFNSMILRLRTSVLVASFGVFALAACASSENAIFDETTPETDAGTDVKTPDAAADSGDEVDAGDDGGEDGAGGAGGNPADDTCGLANCPEPTYPDFHKCCTTANECGYKNGPSGFCYAVEEPGTGGAGGGP